MQYLYLLAWVLAFEDVEDVGVGAGLPGGYVDREEFHTIFLDSGLCATGHIYRHDWPTREYH